MVDIRDFEESVLIETNDFNMPIHQLYAEIRVRHRSMPEPEVRALTSRIIGSMIVEGLITLARATYREIENDLYQQESIRELTQDESDLILKRPDRWEEMDVLSLTDTYEMAITDRGREQLDLYL
jgi:hypothetical protein